MFIVGRDTASGSDDVNVNLEINSDTTSGNYSSRQYLFGTGSTAAAGTSAASATGCPIAAIPGTNGNANAFGMAEVTIIGYANTTFYKKVVGITSNYYGAGLAQNNVYNSFVWKNASAITDLLFTKGATAFVNGSTFTLYGMT